MSWINRIRGWFAPAPRLGPPYQQLGESLADCRSRLGLPENVNPARWGRNALPKEAPAGPSPSHLTPRYVVTMDGVQHTPEQWAEVVRNLRWQLLTAQKSEVVLSKRIQSLKQDWPDIHHNYFTKKGIEARNQRK